MQCELIFPAFIVGLFCYQKSLLFSGEQTRKRRTPGKVRNHALLHYFAKLASSNDPSDTMDYDFVESLLKNGASINTTDRHGQTVFHEVSRSWHTDVAKFLIDHGKTVYMLNC